MQVITIEEASRLQVYLIGGDHPLLENGAPDRWRVSKDPNVLVARQRHLDNINSDRFLNGDLRIPALRAFVEHVKAELEALDEKGAA